MSVAVEQNEGKKKETKEGEMEFTLEGWKKEKDVAPDVIGSTVVIYKKPSIITLLQDTHETWCERHVH